MRIDLFLIKRSIRHWWQRRTRGFDDSVTWSLDHTFHEWILPRLKRYDEIASDVIVITPEFREAIDDMIEGFSQEAWDYDEIAQVKMQKAYKQFSEWHGALWW